MKRYYFKYSFSLKINILKDARFVEHVLKKKGKKAQIQGLFYNPFNISRQQIVKISSFYLKKQQSIKIYRILFNYRSNRQLQNLFKVISRIDFLNSISNYSKFWCIHLTYILYLSRFVKSVSQAYIFIRNRKVYVNGKRVTRFNYIVKPGDVIFVKSVDQFGPYFNTWGNSYGVFFEIPFFLEISFSSKSIVYAGLFI